MNIKIKEKPFFENYQDCYLIQDVPIEIQKDLDCVIRGLNTYEEDELLLSIPLFNQWVECDFNTPSSSYLADETSDYLNELSKQIEDIETGYLIFRSW